MRRGAVNDLHSRIKRSLLILLVLVNISTIVACSQNLHHGLTEEQANEILVTLDKNGIHGDKVTEEGGETLAFTITVPRRDAAKAWQILRENNLPRPAARGFSEVFGKTSLIPTAVEEKALYLQAITGELAKTIEAINGVVDARVHVVLPESDVLKQELQGATTPKAAVLIKYRLDRNGNAPFNPEDIRNLVANSIEGLKPADVTVVSTAVMADKQPDMVYVGPLKLSKDSRSPFLYLLGGFFLLFIIVGVMLVMSTRNSMSLEKELKKLQAASAQRAQLAKTAEK
jgi:type III secretion protein J